MNPDSAAFVERWQPSLTLARKSLIAAQQRQKAYADEKRKEKVFSVGNQVLLSTKYLNIKHAETNRKLLAKWIGPFEVVQVVGPVAYKLKMNPGWRIHHVFHVSLLEPYRPDGGVQPPPPPIELEGAWSMRWSRSYHIGSEGDVILAPLISWPGRVMVQSITPGSPRDSS